jgi:hypothetical protein
MIKIEFEISNWILKVVEMILDVLDKSSVGKLTLQQLYTIIVLGNVFFNLFFYFFYGFLA